MWVFLFAPFLKGHVFVVAVLYGCFFSEGLCVTKSCKNHGHRELGSSSWDDHLGLSGALTPIPQM